MATKDSIKDSDENDLASRLKRKLLIYTIIEVVLIVLLLGFVTFLILMFLN